MPGYATIATVVLSIVAQCLVVWFCHRKRKRRHLLREMFYVITCINPGVDAYRCIVNVPAAEGALVSPHEEMMYLRGAELFSECILGCLIQVRGCGRVGGRR